MKDEIGCCGAYCKTCRAYKAPCKGCRTGYKAGGRDLRRARCQIKICCIKSGLATCADCQKYLLCRTINAFYTKKAYKYGKYRLALMFIRENGYDAFLRHADHWTNAYGRYPVRNLGTGT